MEDNKSKKTQILGYFKQAKEFIVPSSKKDKQKRLKQYKDIVFFVTAIGLISIFQSKIEKLLTVDTNEVQKMTKMGSGFN